MRTIGQGNLGEAFTTWGLHEAMGRHRSKLHLDLLTKLSTPGPDQNVNAVGLLLQVRREPVAAILAAQPTDCFQVEFLPKDVSAIRTMRGVLLTDWTASVLKDPKESGEAVRRLVAEGRPVEARSSPFLEASTVRSRYLMAGTGRRRG